MLVGRFELTTIHYAAPGQSGDDVELRECFDEIILPVSCFEAQIDNVGNYVGNFCFITSTFAVFCEATVGCRFNQTVFRSAVGDLCSSDFDQAVITFAYDCLPGTPWPLTVNLLKFLRSSFTIPWLKCYVHV